MNAEVNRPDRDRNELDEQVGGSDDEHADDDQPVDELSALQAKADENWDLYLRATAELDNVQKRAARDIEHAHKFAIERFAQDLLAVADSLEMALAASGEASVDSLVEGNVATQKLLYSVLQRFGVEQVDPEGEPFDPNLHEAMTTQPSAVAEPGTILTVFQKGYLLNGRLLRPARVVVAADDR